MESNVHKNITSNNTTALENKLNSEQPSTIQDVKDSDLLHSDEAEDSHTEGKPSPPLTQPSLQPVIRHRSTSASTDRSASPTRSKKRAIDTMLEGEEDKECIVLEKPPPLPKRSTPPSPIKPKVSSPTSPSSSSTFIEQPLYVKGDSNYEQAGNLLGTYREYHGVLETGAPILEFLDIWIKEARPNAILVADALFDLLLEEYDPELDERLVARIPLVMNQILQRKYHPA
jgi:hypothetical protein